MRNISFIIISPLLGYKNGNKKFLNLKRLIENINKIKNNFTNPDIVIITGIYNNEYLKIKNGFRICQNQIPFDTGEIEQIRLGLNTIINNKILILKEESSLNIKDIKNGIKNNSKFVTIDNSLKNPGMIIEKGFANNIYYGLDNSFGDILYINNEKDILEFVNKSHNRNKKLYELVNHLINIEPLRVL